MVPPMIFVTFCVYGETELEVLVFGLGGTVFVLGLLTRIWSQVHLRYRLNSPTVLTTTGPYRYVRNPIYIGNTLMLLAACMLAELFWFVPIMLVYCASVYTCVVRYEETHLLDKYGLAYRHYMNSVHRWLPKLAIASNTKTTHTNGPICPSLLAEWHNLLLLLPFITKELMR